MLDNAGINPLQAAILTATVGIVFLSFLLSKGWFAIYKRESLKGLIRSSAFAALLGLFMILVDVKVVLPADLNILFPTSIFFYPAMGFLAEILFHVIPLAILLTFFTSLFKNANKNQILWICILLVALIEPAYQTIAGYSRPIPMWVIAYAGLNVFVINLSELLIFKHYDFVSMYAFRLVYYLVWHIGWGYFRLQLLF